MKGASASLARRRAISVLPTPVGPIIRMFFGVISWRSGSSTCWRRQRLRKAMATARLALPWPTTCLSSSPTISCGVMFIWFMGSVQGFDDVGKVGVDAQLAGDGQRFLDDVSRGQFRVLEQGLGGGLGVYAARTDGADAVFRFQYVAVARDDQGRFGVSHQQHRFQAAQHAVGAPVLGHLDRGAQQVALVLFQLAFEAVEQGEGIGGPPAKPHRTLPWYSL